MVNNINNAQGLSNAQQLEQASQAQHPTAGAAQTTTDFNAVAAKQVTPAAEGEEISREMNTDPEGGGNGGGGGGGETRQNKKSATNGNPGSAHVPTGGALTTREGARLANGGFGFTKLYVNLLREPPPSAELAQKVFGGGTPIIPGSDKQRRLSAYERANTTPEFKQATHAYVKSQLPDGVRVQMRPRLREAESSLGVAGGEQSHRDIYGQPRNSTVQVKASTPSNMHTTMQHQISPFVTSIFSRPSHGPDQMPQTDRPQSSAGMTPPSAPGLPAAPSALPSLADMHRAMSSQYGFMPATMHSYKAPTQTGQTLGQGVGGGLGKAATAGANAMRMLNPFSLFGGGRSTANAVSYQNA